MTAILAALFMLSEALASIPALKANSVFQLLAGLVAKLSTRPPVVLLLFLLASCAPHAIYIQGGEKSSATLEASMTGGRINISGPFVYCENTTGKATRKPPTLAGCPGLEEPTP